MIDEIYLFILELCVDSIPCSNIQKLWSFLAAFMQNVLKRGISTSFLDIHLIPWGKLRLRDFVKHNFLFVLKDLLGRWRPEQG